MIRIMKKALDYYSHDMKLKHKLLISHLILVLAPIFIITLLFYTQLFNIIVTNTKTTELSVARETATNIETTISYIRNLSDEIINHDTFNELLSHTTLKEGSQTYTNILSFTRDIFSKREGGAVTDVKIYLDNRYQSYYLDSTINKNTLYRPISEIENSYWHGIFASTNHRLLYCPPLYLTGKERKNMGELSLTRKIIDTEYNETAYVSVYFDKEYLSSLLKKYNTLSGSANYIIDDRDTLVAYSNNSLAGKYIVKYKDIPPLIPDTNKFEVKSFSSERCYISYREITGTSWIMVTVIPVNSIWSENKMIIIEFLIAYIVILAFAFIVSQKLSGSIVTRISNVIDTMRSVKTGKPTLLHHSKEYDEIGDLIETYNFMISEINLLSEDQLRTAGELRTAEFKALQAQINPHFLYNTLDMINWLAKKGMGEEASNAVYTLSRFYKMTLRKGNIVVTIEEELEHVSLYIQLQNMRYNNKIHYTFDIPDNLLTYTIPKITFQPIVENAIQHGILGKESKEGNIVITGWQEEDELVLLISDDGVGIPENNLDEILTGNIDSKFGSGVAISNIQHRLQLFYDTKFGLTYHSKEGAYTEVEIRIPAIKHT